MKTEYLLIGIVGMLVIFAGFQAYSLFGLSKKLSTPPAAITMATVASPAQQPATNGRLMLEATTHFSF